MQRDAAIASMPAHLAAFRSLHQQSTGVEKKKKKKKPKQELTEEQKKQKEEAGQHAAAAGLHTAYRIMQAGPPPLAGSLLLLCPASRHALLAGSVPGNALPAALNCSQGRGGERHVGQKLRGRVCT